MTYTSIVDMGNSQSLLSRVAAAAAQQGNTTPRQWAANNLLALAADANFTWADKWDYAKGSETINVNPDTGARTDVINDQDILTAVQAYKAAQPGAQGWPAAPA